MAVGELMSCRDGGLREGEDKGSPPLDESRGEEKHLKLERANTVRRNTWKKKGSSGGGRRPPMGGTNQEKWDVLSFESSPPEWRSSGGVLSKNSHRCPSEGDKKVVLALGGSKEAEGRSWGITVRGGKRFRINTDLVSL